MDEPQETPADAPMNRSERRHITKNGGSTDALHDFRGQQAQRLLPGHGPGPPPPIKRGAVHRKTGS